MHYFFFLFWEMSILHNFEILENLHIHEGFWALTLFCFRYGYFIWIGMCLNVIFMSVPRLRPNRVLLYQKYIWSGGDLISHHNIWKNSTEIHTFNTLLQFNSSILVFLKKRRNYTICKTLNVLWCSCHWKSI